MRIYDFKVRAQDGGEVSLSDYQGKVLLIVNTATGCGFTPQYDELQDLYDACHDRGLEILDFPCNQFGEQAPGDDQEIHSFCTGRFGITSCWNLLTDGEVESILRTMTEEAVSDTGATLTNLGNVSVSKINPDFSVAELSVKFSGTLENCLQFLCKVEEFKPGVSWKT